ncbi:class I SAM-dependent methyltransferase [Pseudomonas sp. MWU13-2105]|uniref:class I SAM-dependent methyltransferase n=1 Tax=Pseudomonas sp. MWU13-2105 TaxID=2935074 RepID=UPI00200F3C98|nr:class I SAM-dependent methyltransferase [Pseudomonas sp. MWU13-2105]
MVNLIEKATLMHFHRHRIAEHSRGSTKALGWKDQHSQDARFAVLARIGPLQGCTVLDVGCGHGDLKAYLDRIAPDAAALGAYIGVDLLPEFIETAQARFSGQDNVAFYQCDFSQLILPEVDYVFASGALSYRSTEVDYYQRMIAKFYQAARHGLAFNMLDAALFPEHPLLVGHDRAGVLAYCQSLSGNVEVVDGYRVDDFTLLMWKCERVV